MSLAATHFCKDSSIVSSSSVQLHQMILPYSMVGLIKTLYMTYMYISLLQQVFLCSVCSSLDKMFSFLLAFPAIELMYSFHEKVDLKYSPMCLWLVASFRMHPL